VTSAFSHDGYWNVLSNSSCFSNPTLMSEEAIGERVTYVHERCAYECTYTHTYNGNHKKVLIFLIIRTLIFVYSKSPNDEMSMG
jgi:hypothetical protein